MLNIILLSFAQFERGCAEQQLAAFRKRTSHSLTTCPLSGTVSTGRQPGGSRPDNWQNSPRGKERETQSTPCPPNPISAPRTNPPDKIAERQCGPQLDQASADGGL